MKLDIEQWNGKKAVAIYDGQRFEVVGDFETRKDAVNAVISEAVRLYNLKPGQSLAWHKWLNTTKEDRLDFGEFLTKSRKKRRVQKYGKF